VFIMLAFRDGIQRCHLPSTTLRLTLFILTCADTDASLQHLRRVSI